MLEKWKCRVCSFIEINEQAPYRCPICKAESDRFISIPHIQEPDTSRTVITTISSEPHVESRIPVLVASALEINTLDEAFEGNHLCGLTLTIDPGQEPEHILLDKEAILLVLTGEGEISSDEIKVLGNQDQLDFEKANPEESMDLFSYESGEKTPSDTDEKSSDETSASDDFEPADEHQPDDFPDRISGQPESQPESIALSITQIIANDAILLPSNKKIVIENKGDSPLIIFVAY